MNRTAGLLSKLSVEDFSYDKITSVRHDTGVASGKLIIMAAGNNEVVDQVLNKQLVPFADGLRQRISNGNAPAPATAPAADPLAQLERLGKLREQGILSEDEFQAQKAKILAG